MSKYYPMAKEKYPNEWNLAMIHRLVEKGRLTAEEFEEITGVPYE